MATITVAMETSNNGFSGDQNPKFTSTYDLGNETLKWRTLFADSLFIDGQVVNVTDLAYRGNPNGEPLMKTGGVMSGAIGFKANQYAFTTADRPERGYAIDLKNSDIIGANAILFNDESDVSTEGICFPKTGKGGSSLREDYDTIRAKDGVMYFNSSKVYTEATKPTPSDIGALAAGNWSVSGQDLKVHGKRALVGTTDGVLYLGYSTDFSTFKCGNNTIWHSGNLNQNTTLGVGNLVSTQSYITLGGRKLYISSSEPSGAADGTVWIK